MDGHGRVTVTVSDSHSDSDELAGYAAMLCYEPYYESMNTTSHTATPLLHNTTQYKTRWMLCVSNVMCVSISCCIAIAASLHHCIALHPHLACIYKKLARRRAAYCTSICLRTPLPLQGWILCFSISLSVFHYWPVGRWPVALRPCGIGIWHKSLVTGNLSLYA